MTDRAAPGAQGSTVRNMEYGEMGGAPATFLVPYDERTRSSQRWDGLDDFADAAGNTDKVPFGVENDHRDANYIKFEPGEGFVDGWFATDEIKQSPDLSPYEEEEVTLVVGWDPDAVYSSDVHDHREDADSVFIDLERNVNNRPYIKLFRGIVRQMPEGGYSLDDGSTEEDTIYDLRPVGRPMETISPDRFHDGNWGRNPTPGVNLLRGRPTTFTGAVNTGPHETPVNAERSVHAFAPVNADAVAGTEAEYHDLDVAGSPAGRYVYTHGNGGNVYGTQYDASLGRLARINANMSWEYETFADVENWSDGGGEVTGGVAGHPRRIQAEVSDVGGGTYGGVQTSTGVSFESLNEYRITFKDVSFTDNGTNELFIGVQSDDVTTNPSNGDGYRLVYQNDGSTTTQFFTNDTGTSSVPDFDWTETYDITFVQDDNSVSVLVDGVFHRNLDHTVDAYYKPYFILNDADTTADTVECAEIITEALE